VIEARRLARAHLIQERQAWRFAGKRGEDAGRLWRALLWSSGELARATGIGEPPAVPVPHYGPDAQGDVEAYREWVKATEGPAAEPGSALGDRDLAEGPLVSVVVPVYRPDLDLFEEAIGSVLAQTYPRLELCLCDDGSGDPDLTKALARAAAGDERVRVVALGENGGISAATNRAIEASTGEWIAFLDQDDLLAAEALEAVVRAVLADPEADVVYTDDDKIDMEGRRFAPQFKPDWCPDLLLSCAYWSHLVVIRRTLVEEVGGLRSAFDGSQDHDLELRVSESARQIVHVPRVLYHWRAVPGSAAGDAAAKPWANEAGRRAVEDALVRRGERGWAEHHDRHRGFYHVRRELVGMPLVSIVVPFKDGAGLLQRFFDTVTADPGYDRYELVLVDNASTEPEIFGLLDRYASLPNVRIVEDPRPFNWPAINNLAVSKSAGDVLLLMNNDIEARRPGWMRAMLEHAQRPEVGAVGARLLYLDGRVQSVGTVIGMGGPAAHVMAGLPGEAPGYMAFAVLARNWSAVTGACLMVRRGVYEQVGGLDESLAVSYNDVDFCLKIREAGYLIVYTPLAELVHAESASRGLTGFGKDVEPFIRRWESILRKGDPLYSPNLALLDQRCVVRRAEEKEVWEEIFVRNAPWWKEGAS
jgi:GT2 family glycosyltransferase